MRKITPYNIRKGLKYLRHFGPKAFWVRLRERMEPEEVPYGPWYEHYRPTPEELEKQRKKNWKNPVLFSICVPVWRTPERFLREMIESCLAQTYENWELCIANADPSDGPVRTVLEAYQQADSRIHVRNLTENGGIAANQTQAVRMAGGDYIAFLDHDDMISPAALWEMAAFLEKHPDTGVLYTDEDKISADGSEHFQPNLKPDYNPDLLRSNNYICHFLAVRADVASGAGMPDGAFNGAQDYEYIFRTIYQAQKMGLAVGHVPEILYHWRTHASSTADNPLSKTYAYEAGARAIREELARRGEQGTVTLKKDPGFYRVHYALRGHPKVSILIPNKDMKQTLERCLTSLYEKTTYDRYEVIVIENNSAEAETFDYYREIDGKRHTRVVTWKGTGFNYPALNNYGFSFADGEYIVCLNNDIEVITPGWIEEMLGVCGRPGTGIVGARLYYPDDTVQHAGIVIGIGGIAGSMFVNMKRSWSGYLHKADLMQDLSAVTAACMMVRRSVWEQLGGFDEKLSVAFNDVDLCLRARQLGYLVVYDPYVEMYHWESRTRGAEDSKEKVRRFQSEIELIRSRWTRLLIDGDPYYNKNLSLSKWNYSLRPGERMRM